MSNEKMGNMPPVRVTTRGMGRTKAIVDYAKDKALRMGGLLERAISVEVVLENCSPSRQTGKDFKVEYIVDMPKKDKIFAEKKGGDLYEAIDECSDAVTSQLVKWKERTVER